MASKHSKANYKSQGGKVNTLMKFDKRILALTF